LVLGIALLKRAAQVLLSRSRMPFASGGLWHRIDAGNTILAGIGVVAAAGTLHMVWQSTSLQPSERYAGAYLLTPQFRAVQDKLESVHGSNVYIYESDPLSNSGLLNGWLSYFARDNRVWLGNPHVNDTDLELMPEEAATLDTESLPSDVLMVIDARASGSMIGSNIGSGAPLWSSGDYLLLAGGAGQWAVPVSIRSGVGPPVADARSYAWVGHDPLTIDVVAAVDGQLTIGGAFDSSAGNTPANRHLAVTTDKGYSGQWLVQGGDSTFTLPIHTGSTRITLVDDDGPVVHMTSPRMAFNPDGSRQT
jgi:hypothetical protein